MEEIRQAIVSQSTQIKALQEGFSQVLSALNTIAQQGNVSQIKHDVTQLKDKLTSIEGLMISNPGLSNVTQVLSKATRKKDKGEMILGFRLCQKSTITEGKKYLKWYASRRIEGKQVWVYLGEDTSKAESKISTWLAKHPGKI